jgi:hypothetical protein
MRCPRGTRHNHDKGMIQYPSKEHHHIIIPLLLRYLSHGYKEQYLLGKLSEYLRIRLKLRLIDRPVVFRGGEDIIEINFSLSAATRNLFL